MKASTSHCHCWCSTPCSLGCLLFDSATDTVTFSRCRRQTPMPNASKISSNEASTDFVPVICCCRLLVLLQWISADFVWTHWPSATKMHTLISDSATSMKRPMRYNSMLGLIRKIAVLCCSDASSHADFVVTSSNLHPPPPSEQLLMHGFSHGGRDPSMRLVSHDLVCCCCRQIIMTCCNGTAVPATAVLLKHC